MADDSRTFEIKVITTSDPNGARQAAQGLQEVGDATRKAGEHAEELNKNSRETRRLFGELDRLVPGLGETLRGMFEPESLGMVGALVTVELLIDRFQEWKKQQEEAAQLLGELWKAQVEGAHKAADAARDYAREMNKVPTAMESINREYSSAKTILEAQLEAHRRILEAMEKQELAAAKGDTAKEEEIRRRYEMAGRDFNLDAESAQIEQQKRELQDAVSAALAAQLTSDRDQSAKEEAQTEPAEVTEAKHYQEINQEKFNAANKYLEDNGGIDKARETVQQISNQNGGQLTTFGRDLQNMIDVVDKFKAAEKTMLDWDSHVKETIDAAAESKRQFDELNKKVNELNDQINTAKQVLDIHVQTARKQNAFDIVEGAGGSRNFENIISQGASALDAYEHGQRLTQTQVEQLTVFHALFDTVNGNSIAIINIAKQALSHGVSLTNEIRQLQQQFTNLQQQVRNNARPQQ